MVNNLYWGNIDAFILLILIVANTIAYFKFRDKKLGCIATFGIIVLYIIILPLLSQGFEIRRVVSVNGTDDSFTLLYTYLRFPLYWILGIIQLIIITIFFRPNKSNNS